MSEHNNIVLQAMEQCLRSRIEIEDHTFGERLKFSEGIYAINLGRQVGHSSNLIDFANKYNERTVILTANANIKNVLSYSKEFATVQCPIENIGSHDISASMKNLDLAGRDIVIIDNYSTLRNHHLENLEEFKRLLPTLSGKPIYMIFHIQ